MRDPLAPKTDVRPGMDQQLWPVIVGGVVATLGVIVGWFQSHKKAEIDESALVLGKWKELVEQHQSDIKDLKEEFHAYRKNAEDELEAVRHRLREVENEFTEYRRTSEKRMSELENENIGLKRAIIQNSRSTAVQLGRVDSSVAKMQTDKDEAHDEINEHLRKLDQAGDNSVPKKGGGKDVKRT